MITEQDWAKFAKHVQVGTPVKWNVTQGDQDFWIRGSLVEVYPHAEKAYQDEMQKDEYWKGFNFGIHTLLVSRGGSQIEPVEPKGWLFYEMHYWVEKDQCWYCFDDILMFEEEGVNNG
jgi:hypothetical protein